MLPSLAAIVNWQTNSRPVRALQLSANELENDKECPMLEIDQIHRTVLNKGFKPTRTSQDGTTLWFRKPKTDSSHPEHLVCIDLLTQSGTVFWKKDESSFESKTFRSAEAMGSWLEQK